IPTHLSSPFSFTSPPPSSFFTLSLHDALPILVLLIACIRGYISPSSFLNLVAAAFSSPRTGPSLRTALQSRRFPHPRGFFCTERSEEHTSELQSRGHLVCRLLLEKKKKYTSNI